MQIRNRKPINQNQSSAVSPLLEDNIPPARNKKNQIPHAQNTNIVFHNVSSNPYDLLSKMYKAVENLGVDCLEFFNQFNEHIFNSILEAKLISEGEVIKRETNAEKGLYISQLVSSGGGVFLPSLLGTAMSSLSVGTSLAYMALRCIRELSQIEAAKNINNLFLNHIDRANVAARVAFFITYVYQHQIKQLTSQGKGIFASMLTTMMLHYLATNEGKNSSFLKVLYGESNAITYLREKLSMSVPIGFAKQNVTSDPAMKMLSGLFACAAENNNSENFTRLPVIHQTGFLDPWYGEELLSKIGIKSGSDFYFIDKGLASKYGYINMPKELALQFGYEKYEPSDLNSGQEEFNDYKDRTRPQKADKCCKCSIL